MSTILVVHCDYKDGECLEEFNGFDPDAEPREMNEILRQKGWEIEYSSHFCPKHASLRKVK